jgi:hypothetical protein
MTVATLVSSGHAHASEVERVTIYYYDRNVDTRSALTVGGVREIFHVRVEIMDRTEAQKLRDRLFAVSMVDSDAAQVVDVRVVIDLHLSNGKISTFYASQFRLYASGGTKSAPIDHAFKRKFQFRFSDW